jgi:hypothetical protein
VLSFRPVRSSGPRLITLALSVLALLLLTFGSASVDAYVPLAVPGSNATEVPTEEVAHQGASMHVATATRAELARARAATGRGVHARIAAPRASRRAPLPASARWVTAPPRPPGSAPTPLRL